MNVKKTISKLFTSVKGAIIPSSDFLEYEAEDLFDYIDNFILVEINCKRILITYPIIIIFTFLSCFPFNNIYNILTIVEMICFFIIIGSTSYVAIKTYYYISKGNYYIHSYTEYFKFLYYIFWYGFSIPMIVLSFIRLDYDHTLVNFFVLCVIVSVGPLVNTKRFLKIFLYTIVVIFAIFVNNFYFLHETSLESKVMLINNEILITLLSINFLGLLVQKVQIYIWKLNIYINFKAFLDPLTNVYNRRGGNYALHRKIKKSKKDITVGVIMLDIDFFKKYNDTFGHDAGDVCLKSVGKIIRYSFEGRKEIIIRHGGEEFVILLVDTNADKTQKYAEALRQGVESAKIPAANTSVSDYVTVSIGVTTVTSKEFEKYEDLVANADKALYISKENGRNQVNFVSE
ncbi:diguanylate cyclase (GGDEF) domain-containing protein [Acetitomaculum ruminis DSM 5522]|uniref:Diguanylate cyclase (GGDEF) domain-containing protein n=1 Tax=Acetitomaculum ruminis DSM 5522 TaxID=1120918 RepID=A0A1I0WY58_9FIRM|nr:GGDEF domain-containing protein [Acetitomaculum ruminis]SFA93675.1 diguanylate cyclase (GGDEF) domain-containing protein [Acetitomaculum ruminis DSM 5522]